MQLPAGTTAAISTVAFFGGETVQDSGATSFTGPVARDYLFEHVVEVKKVHDPGACGSVVPLNLNSQAQITGPGASSALLTVDSIDGKVAANEKKASRNC